MQWHGRLGLPPASNQAFGEYLERKLQVTPDAAPFSGESHWWTPEILSPVLGGSAATAAAARPPAAARATLGTLGTPAWAFNPHPRCADSCCPVPCPPSGISTASAWPTGPYDGPPAAYPGLAAAPPGRPPAARDAGGGVLGADRSGLRIGAPSMPAAAWGSLGAGASAWLGAAPPAATPGGAALNPVRGPGSGFKFAQPPPRGGCLLERNSTSLTLCRMANQ